MVARVGGCYGAALTGAWGVTQGDPLPPTILNVVMDAVLHHWVSVMVEGSEERGERGQEGMHQNALFYADDGMVASSVPQWFQKDFITLVGLFYRVGLRTNVGKTVGMVFRSCQAVGNSSEAVYGRRITGDDPRTGSD